MRTTAVVMTDPKVLSLDKLSLAAPDPHSVVVDVAYSGISTGTEKLFWNGTMPPFPGMGYPLVPGYEAAGEVVEAGSESGAKVGDWVFVPGADCYDEAKGLFGGATRRLVTRADRMSEVDAGLGAESALLALAATAVHAIAGPNTTPPDLIVGHGVLGRLLARATIASGAPAPVVWDTDAKRRSGARGYEVIHPEHDESRNYSAIYDASGDANLLNDLIGRIRKGGEVVLAGFYAEPISFAFPPAFMKEARLRVAAEWTPDDLHATRMLLDKGLLSLGDLITHQADASDASAAYETAFTDPDCLKMILDWRGTA